MAKGLWLMHHGIKGMRWGVRRYQNADGSLTPEGAKRYGNLVNSHMKNHMSFKAKNGDVIELDREMPSKIVRGISKINSGYRDSVAKNSSFKITVNGKRIGDLELNQDSDSELNVVWIGIDKKYRGNGYASAVMENVKQYAIESGNSKVTLEVPGTSNDARHIYEKQGFVAVKRLSEDDVWGGLTAMELPLYESRLSTGRHFVDSHSV